MLGIAQKLFSEKHDITFHFKKKETHETWPLLNQLLSINALEYVDFALAEKIAKDKAESTAALICHLSIAARQGHLCVTITNNIIIPSVAEVWNLCTSKELLGQLHKLIIQSKTTLNTDICIPVNHETNLVTPLCHIQDRYYLQRFWILEQIFIKHTIPLLKANPFLEANDLKAISNPSLTDEQALSVTRGLQYPLTVITGGPGTGKTHTAGFLLKTLWNNLSLESQKNCKIALAAPTGKAAANLENSIRQATKDLSNFPDISGQTLHALLRIHQLKNGQARKLLDINILLIDECSMIDVQMMGVLMSSLKPGTQLILLGDKHQLPPIDAGSIFADLVDFLKCSTEFSSRLTELTKSLRAEFHDIIDFARVINKGDAKTTLKMLKEQTPTAVSSLKYTEFTKDFEKNRQRELIASTIDYFPRIQTLPENPLEALTAFSQFRILTPMRQGLLGTEQLNQLFFHTVSARSKMADCYAVPIMIISNHYELDLFNGELGLLIKHHEDSRLDFAFFAPRNAFFTPRKISALRMPAFEYAYCMSIHKSQGSEFQHVLLLLPDGSEMFGREALYTGATRAKRTLEVWSTPKVLHAMVDKVSLRHSGISQSFEDYLRDERNIQKERSPNTINPAMLAE